MYSRQIDGAVLSFGVSGLLYKANVLMYDHQSESLWSQLRRQAVAGPRAGARLQILPSTLTSWKQWRRRHPDTEVLSLETGYDRDYRRDPYADYYRSRQGLFSFFTPAPGEEAKALVVGIRFNGTARAYPLELLRERRLLTDTQGDRTLVLTFDPATDRVEVRDGSGEAVPFSVAYWFVWKGMFPGTTVFAGRLAED